MSHRSLSFGCRFALVVGCALGSLALLVVVAGRAEGKPASKCAKGTEQAGCKLPIGARFQWEVSKPADSQITAEVTSRGWLSVTIYDVGMKCKEFLPSIGNETYLAFSTTLKQRPEVGKTYTVTKTESRGGGEEGEGVTSSRIGVRFQFKSAKRLVLSVTMASDEEGRVLCNGAGSWTLKRL